jgi:hypothetical protein
MQVSSIPKVSDAKGLRLVGVILEYSDVKR